MNGEGHLLRTGKRHNLKKTQVIMNIMLQQGKTTRGTIFVIGHEHISYVLPFKPMSVSLYIDFLNGIALEVCGTVNKVYELDFSQCLFVLYNQFGKHMYHLGGMGAQWLVLSWVQTQSSWALAVCEER